ncbi:DgyrCDS11843 [Dimorphilus gyrociliatus]|uniref:DgyrCDS11843 n=1 Tax=Dimorphilus gyrociliatus TaxID=2664684 RepID=A0A7I8W769_9ANNE|nr:DgyrCDS11843 [Dimorphilus gyrociliatus]
MSIFYILIECSLLCNIYSLSYSEMTKILKLAYLINYISRETRLIEALEDPHICDKILKYNVHAERKGSLRYAKGQSETMQTLHNLVHKGVKVVYDIPYELWNETSSEIVKMHRACFALANDYEEDIQEWYYNHQDTVSLMKYVCADRYLKGKDKKCLDEIFFSKGESDDDDDTDSKAKQKKLKPKKSKTDSQSEKKNPKYAKGDKGRKVEL